MSNNPRIYVIVLNWNGYEDTRRSIESLSCSSYPNLTTIIVDNGSLDRSPDRLREEYPGLIHIRNKENLGFARGCNVGIRMALDDPEAAYVLLLNNDAELEPDSLCKAVETFESDDQIGIVGGKILISRDTKRIWYAGGEVLRWRGGVSVRGAGEMDEGQYDTACEVGFVTGAMMLIRRQVLTSVGLLPEEYFFGTEEYDYSYTVRRAGYKLFYEPRFLAYHPCEGSHSNQDLKYVYLGYRNKLIMQERLLPSGFFPLWKMGFKIYGRFLARKKWRRLRESIGMYDSDYNEMEFALKKALSDHAKDKVTEATLARFVQELDQYRQACRGNNQ